MTRLKITPLEFTYKKPDTDVWVLNTDDIPLEKTQVKDQQIVHLGPGSVGGNHKHPRIEWFIALGDLELLWLDEAGQTHIEPMHPNGQLLLIEMPAQIPHAVRNTSADKSVILFEYANAKASNIEVVKVI